MTFIFGMLAALLSALLILLLLRSGLAWRIASDSPNARSLHTRITPRIGGLGIMLALLAALACVLSGSSIQTLAALALGLSAISLWDDRHGLPVLLRFASHWLAAGLAMWAISPPDIGWIPILASCLACVWMTNLYNFMDGSDGMAGSMALIGFGTLAIAGQGEPVGVLSAVIAGGAAGFLLFNWHPARVFMGDCGSVPLGFLAAVIGVQGATLSLWPWWFPVWVFSPFIADATVTLLRRAIRGERVWQAHHEHYFQRTIRMGAGHAHVAGCWCAAMLLAGLSALLALQISNPALWAALVTGMLAIYLAAALTIDAKWRQYIRRQGNEHG